MITKIQSNTITHLFATFPSSAPAKSAKLVVAAYMHQLILDSWKSFQSSLKEHAQENKKVHRARGETRQRVEGVRRIVEDTRIRRQASHFRYFEGMDLEVGRHLHVQV